MTRPRSTTTGAGSPRCARIPTRRPSTSAIRWSRSGTTTTWPTTPGATAPRTHDPDGARCLDRPRRGRRPRPAGVAARRGLPDPHDPLTTWRSVAVGDLAELLLLDTRLQGRDRQAGDDESPDLDDPDRSLLGAEQRALVGRAAGRHSRPWSVIASGVVVNEIELTWPPPAALDQRAAPERLRRSSTAACSTTTSGMATPPNGPASPAELRARGERGGRTLILSGRRPLVVGVRGALRRRDGEAVAVEVTTPAVSSAAMGRAHLPGMWRLLDRAANDLDHVRWAEVTERGYCTIDLTRDAVTATWWFVHPYDDDPSGPRRARDGVPLRARRVAASAGAHGSGADRPGAGGPPGSAPAAARRPRSGCGDGDVPGSRPRCRRWPPPCSPRSSRVEPAAHRR